MQDSIIFVASPSVRKTVLAPCTTPNNTKTSCTALLSPFGRLLCILSHVVFYNFLALLATLLAHAVTRLGVNTGFHAVHTPTTLQPTQGGTQGEEVKVREHSAAAEISSPNPNYSGDGSEDAPVIPSRIIPQPKGATARVAINSESGFPSRTPSPRFESPLLDNILLAHGSLSNGPSTRASNGLVGGIIASKQYPTFSAPLVAELYVFESKLGEGGQGVVNLCQHRVKGSVAVKFFTKKYRAQGLVECEALIKLRGHRNVVTIHDAFFEDEDRFAIVMDYVSDLSLDDLVPTKPKFVTLEMPDVKLGGIAKQLLSAISFLQSNNMIHRDIKPSNVMIDERGLIKLVDFGVATQAPVTASPHWVGTLPYIAPELILIPAVDYGCPADIWSLGCLLLQLADSLLLRRTYDNEIEVQDWLRSDAARRARVRSANKRDGRAVDFIKSCLTWDQNHRPTAEELAKHAFITEVACEQSDIMGLGNFDHLD